jgi:hypothetical protein
LTDIDDRKLVDGGGFSQYTIPFVSYWGEFNYNILHQLRGMLPDDLPMEVIIKRNVSTSYA